MLINCPNCNKPITDTAEKCIHCGAVIKAENEPDIRIKRDYMSLDNNEVANMFNKFKEEEPEIEVRYNNTIKKQSRSSTIETVIYLILFLSVLGVKLLGGLYDFDIILPICVLVGLFFIVLVAYRSINNKYKYEIFFVYKHFGRWLSKNGIENFNPGLVKTKDKALYESIKID